MSKTNTRVSIKLRNPIAFATLMLVVTVVHAQTWVVTRERVSPEAAASCVLQSSPVNGIALRINNTIDIVSEHLLDERADRATVAVDQGAVFPGQQRLSASPHTIVLSGAHHSFDREFFTPHLIDQFRRGRRARVTVETILNGAQQSTIPLVGFTAAYERFLSCRSHFGDEPKR